MTIEEQLLEHEGFRAGAYRDSRGYLTIGIGRLVDPTVGGGITREEGLYLLANDVKRARADLDAQLPWWRQLDEVRQRVLIDLVFNLGLPKLLKFRKTLASVQAGEYSKAALELRSSQPWASQVGDRALRLAEMLRTGQEVPMTAVPKLRTKEA